MLSRAASALVALTLLLAAPRLARAEDWIFFDAHPVHPAAGGGFCELAGAHVHDYAPIDPSAFVLRDGLWFFVGDPVVFGYRGTVYRFDGPHEVTGSEGFAACTRAGVHYHLYPPAVVAGADSTVLVTPWLPARAAYPYWWDDRPRRRAEPRPAHPYPVAPTPAPPAPPAVGPPASRAIAPRLPPGPRRPVAPVAPPPPARGADRSR